MKYKRKNTFIKHTKKLPIFSLLAVFLFASCDSALFEKKQPEQEQSLCTVYGKIAPKYNGAYPSQIFGDSQLQNQAGRSAFAGIQTGTYSVTATKCIQNEGSWSLSTDDDDIITALPDDVGIDEVTGTGTFAIRLPEGSWYLSAELNNEDKLLLETPELDSLTEDDIVTINTTDKTYDKNISITVSPKITTDGTGNVSLEFFNAVSSDALGVPPGCSYSMRIGPAYISENEAIVEQTAYIAEGDFDENGKVTVELSNIPSGSYKYLFYFFIKNEGRTLYGFPFQETINVFDNLTTNCWVKDSVTDDSNDAKIYLTLKDNPSIPNEAECKITDDCINLMNESNTYEVSTKDDLSQALSSIRYANEVYDGDEDLRPEYKIIVDGTIIDEVEENIPTLKLKNSITKPINITICGKTPQATIKRTWNNESSNIIEIDDIITVPVTLTLCDITLEGGEKAVKTSQNTIINIKGKVLTKDNYIDFADGAVMNVIAPLSDDSKICFNTPAADCVFVKDESQNLTKSPDQYFVHKDGYRVGYKLDDTGNEIKTDIKVYGANNGSITQKIEDNISFQLTYPEQVKYYNNTFYLYNGYANTTDYEKGQIKVEPFVDGNLLTVSDDFNITVASLVSENPEDGELLTSETDSELKYKTFQLKTSNQKLGKYIVTATLNYNGKTYSTSWNVEVYDFEYELNNRVIPVGSSQTFDVKAFYCNGSERKEIQSNININKITLAYVSSGSISYNSSTCDTNNPFSTSTESEYLISANVIYKLGGENSPYAECVSKNFYTYVNNTIPFFVHPSFTGTSTGEIIAPFKNVNDAITHIESINDSVSTYAIYLMGDVIAQSEGDFVDVFNKQINESGTLYGKTFVRINATDDNTAPLKLKITSYGAPVNQYAINANCTGPDAQTAISGVTARVMFVGKNAELTLEKVQITGGKSSNSGIAPANIGTAILVFGKVIFNSGLIGSTSYQNEPKVMNDDSLCANTNSSVFLEKNSSFIMNGGEFNGYATGIYVNELANCEINGGSFSVGNIAINGINSDLIKVENCSFENNSLFSNKKLFSITSSSFSLKNCTIQDNYVSSSSPAYDSGVLIFANYSNVFIDGCTIGNTGVPNNSDVNAITGGAVYYNGSGNILQIKDTTFSDCSKATQTVKGGFLYINGGVKVILMENYSANEDIYLNYDSINGISSTITLDDSFSLKEGCNEVQITLASSYPTTSGTQILNGDLNVVKENYTKFIVKKSGSADQIQLNERGQIK